MATVVAIGAVFVAFALSWVLKIDRPIYFDWLHAGRTVDRWGPDWFNQLGKVPLLIVIRLEEFDLAGAMTLAVVMMIFSFILLITINLLERWASHYEQ